MGSMIAPAAAGRSFVPHRLHDAGRRWPETNCYVDLWIEVLAALDEVPEAAFGHAVCQRFGEDQFTFSKVPIEDLIRVGNRIELAEEAAPTRPHPGTPSTPPWNKIVDPAVAVVDKVRDVVTRRTTYARDL